MTTDFRARFPGITPADPDNDDSGATMADLAALPDMGGSAYSVQANNTAKASWAAQALTCYVDRVGDNGYIETNVADLLADLLHLADAVGFEFSSALSTAYTNFMAETNGEY